MMALRIDDWRAWAPGIDDAESWRRWADGHITPLEDRAPPATEFVPAMQRRRLSRLARMVMHTAWPLCADDEQLPLVYASRHGETTHTFAMLEDIGREAPLSPTRFGLSVHNAIAGQWSILRGQRGESVAIAGDTDTFEHAMVEAAALLADGASAVIVVIAEERPPAAYDGWIVDVPFSYTVALRVAAAGDPGTGNGWQLALRGDAGAASPTTEPHALAFLRAMHHGAALEHSCKTRRWSWQPIR